MRRAGFTLAEVAVTLVIVGVAMVLVLQGLNTAKLLAAHTHNKKTARELALVTLGEIESGLYWEDMDDQLDGSYSEEGYPKFRWTVVFGDEQFPTTLREHGEQEGWLPNRGAARDEYADERDDDDDEDAEEPYERVKIRVEFPAFYVYDEEFDEFILERWVPWVQVYGEDEEDAAETTGAGS